MRLSRSLSIQVGIVLLFPVVIAAVFGPLISPFPVDRIGVGPRLQPPSTRFLFGTDDLGRDLFSRIVYSSRISMQMGFIALSIAVTFGTLIGLTSGFYGSLFDIILMRLIDILLAFPPIFLALAIISILGPGLIVVMIAVGISSIPEFSRIVRSSVLIIKSKDYVLASRALGANNQWILLRKILPNVMAPIIVLSTLLFPSAILAAAGLSFIGLGADPQLPDWGTLLVDGQVYYLDAPWLFYFPGFAIFLTVLGTNMLGNGLIDVLNPELRNHSYYWKKKPQEQPEIFLNGTYSELTHKNIVIQRENHLEKIK